jgi:hypothetical protein
MGEFSKLESRLFAVILELGSITDDLNKLRYIVKDSKREKIDDVQRQLTKLQEKLDKEKNEPRMS